MILREIVKFDPRVGRGAFSWGFRCKKNRGGWGGVGVNKKKEIHRCAKKI